MDIWEMEVRVMGVDTEHYPSLDTFEKALTAAGVGCGGVPRKYKQAYLRHQIQTSLDKTRK